MAEKTSALFRTIRKISTIRQCRGRDWARVDLGHVEPLVRSRPGLSRPSTPCLLPPPSPPPHAGEGSGQDVDANDKRGHDAGNVRR